MPVATELARFAAVCTAIANAAAEEGGFVPVRRLLSEFDAQLLIRPLLVEGMLALIQRNGDSASDASQWAVLVDSERHPISERDVEQESAQQPLSARLRNTIAHELVHSLAFRPSEFGIDLRLQGNDEKSQGALVKAIEQETECLSPLLLWPERSLADLLKANKEALSIEQLQQQCRRLGISRYLLVNRLGLLGLAETPGLRYHAALQNLGIGIGEWNNRGAAVLRSWPLFINFDRNIVPNMFLKFPGQDRVPAESMFPHNGFTLCGGSSDTVEFVTDAGTRAVPAAGKMTVKCSAERTSRKPGSSFLYVVSKQKADTAKSAS